MRPNRPVAQNGDVLATTTLQPNERTPEGILTRLNLLLASAYAEVQRRGSLTEGLQFDGAALSQLAETMIEGPSQSVVLKVIASGGSASADPVVVTVEASP